MTTFFAASSDVQLSFFFFCEDPSGFTDIVRAAGPPRNLFWVLGPKDLDICAIHNQVLLVAIFFGGNSARIAFVDAVVRQLVDHVGDIHERLVDALDLNIGIGHCSAEHETPNAAEAIDAQRGWHDDKLKRRGKPRA